jgi:DNA-binding transcriptional MerR regulator
MRAERLMESGEAARILGVSSVSVANFSDAGLLRVHALTTRGCRLFKRADVIALKKSRRGAR